MAQDFYQVLGVDKGADPERIRQAYRSEVKKYHPDASGTGASAARFRAVEEAYETLRDAGRRAAYDRALERREPARRGTEAGWPGSPSYRQWGHDAGRAAPLGSFGFGGLYAEPLLEVLLSAEEARRGVALAVEVPVVDVCPHCGDSGLWARMTCLTCGGSGRLRSLCPVTLELPPGLRHGHAFRCDLGLAGDASFRVRVLVSPA